MSAECPNSPLDLTPDVLPKCLTDQVLPHFTASVLFYHPKTRDTVLLWRTDKVRSAKNCLAIPSGLLEHGESFETSLVRELGEELGVPAEMIGELRFHTLYRNQPGDGFDWVIGVWSAPCHPDFDFFTSLNNAEPEKHEVIVWPLHMVARVARLELDQVAGHNKLFGGNLAQPLLKTVTEVLASL